MRERVGEGQRERIPSRLRCAEPNAGLELSVRSWPEPKSRVGHLTDWATQVPLELIFFKGVRSTFFWHLTLLGILLASRICGLVSSINLGKFSLIIFQILLLFILSCLLITHLFDLFFLVVPQFLKISLVSVFFSWLHFSFGSFYWNILKLWGFFPQPCPSSLVIKPIKDSFFISLHIPIFLFFVLHRISVSLLALPICSCMLSSLSVRVLHIFIVVALNSWSCNSAMSVVPGCGSNACCLFKKSVFLVSVCLVIFLRHGVLS